MSLDCEIRGILNAPAISTACRNHISCFRLLYLKKLDGYPVIREVEEEETEELSGTMDLHEIDRMAKQDDEDDEEEGEENKSANDRNTEDADEITVATSDRED